MAVILTRSEMQDVKRKVEFYLSVHRFEAAEKLLKASIASYGPVANLHNLLGLTYHKQSRFPDAIDQFRRALKVNPSYVEAALNLAATLCDLSQYDEAREQFSKIQVEVDQTYQLPHLVLGRLANQHAQNGKLYHQAGLKKEAIHEFRKALELFPKMPDVKLFLGKLYLDENEPEKAKKELEELLELAPDVNEARNLIGLIYYKQGREDRAREEWDKAFRVNPDDHTTRAYVKIANAKSSIN